MIIKFYNTLNRKKEEFVPIKKGEVKIYSCGPTIYNYVHIGNLRAYIFTDILIKTLQYFKYKVLSVMNLTDVDDKTIRDSKKIETHNKTPNEILHEFTTIYEKAFYKDLDSLNISKAKKTPKATNSIKEIEFIIEKLFQNKYAYESVDGIYFDISKYKDYGKLIKLDMKNQQYNKKNRVVLDEYEKDNLQDFVLWKFKKDKDEPSWTIKINNKEYIGRPGWHIECSAMAYKNLGKTFDIHTGGVDLRFPHHENEIAQSSCAFNINSQANFWMHNEHLLVDNKKMSKSLGNFYTLRDLIKKNFQPLSLREVFLRSHYSQQLNFTFESLDAGQTNIKKINDFYSKLKIIKFDNKVKDIIKKIYQNKIDKFEKALQDDLNTPVALSAVYEFMNEINRIKTLSKEDLKLSIDFMKKTNKVLGLLKIEEEVSVEVLELAKQREKARQYQNWEESDKLRDEIKELGYIVKDDKNTKQGFILTSC